MRPIGEQPSPLRVLPSSPLLAGAARAVSARPHGSITGVDPGIAARRLALRRAGIAATIQPPVGLGGRAGEREIRAPAAMAVAASAPAPQATAHA